MFNEAIRAAVEEKDRRIGALEARLVGQTSEQQNQPSHTTRALEEQLAAVQRSAHITVLERTDLVLMQEERAAGV